MRKLFLTVFLVLGLCVFMGCNKKEATATDVVIANAEAGLELSIPDGWEKISVDNTMLAARSEKPTDKVPANVNVVGGDLGGEYSQEYYAKANMDYFLQSYPDVKVLERGETYWIIENKYEGQKHLTRQVQYFYIKGTFGYTLTFTAVVDEFDENKATFDQIEKTFKIK